MPGSRERQARTIYRPPLNTNLAQSTLSQKAKDRESSSRRDDREQARTCNPSPRAPRSIHPRHQNYSHASELKLASRYTARAQARVAMIASSFDRGAMGASSSSRRDGRELARASEQCAMEVPRGCARGGRGGLDQHVVHVRREGAALQLGKYRSRRGVACPFMVP